MKLNKRFLILLLLLSILILGFNSVGAADLSGFSEGGTADLSIDDVSVSHQSIDSVSSSVESLNDADDDLSESISSQDDDLIIENMDSLLVSNGALNEGPDSIQASNDEILKDSEECIYVSKNGNDANDGSMESPVGTVSKAIELAINNETGCYRIFVLEGRYEVYNVDLDSTYLTIEGSGIGKTIFDGMGYTGGMFSIHYSNLTIRNLSIVNGVNTGSSGGAFTNMGNLTLENINASDCYVKNYNGGVIYSVGNLNLVNSSFSNNIVDPTNSGGNGGVIYIDGYYSNLEYPPSLNISGCEFRSNTANGDTFGGGAIYMQYADGYKSISDSRFIGNKALAGGAIFLQNSEGHFFMNNVSFIANKAAGTVSNYGGGAINLIGKTDGRVGSITIINSEFVNNTAVNTRGGGAILDRNVDLNITNSFIFNNKDNSKNMSIYKDTTVYYPNGGRIYLEGNWWGENNAPVLDKITIRKWIVMELLVELSDKMSCDYNVKLLLNHYNDGSLILDNYYPFEHQFSITSSNGILNQSEGILKDNEVLVLLSSQTKDNLITATIDNQSIEFNTKEIISNLSSEDLTSMIENANSGDVINLSSCSIDNVSNVVINKNLTFVGNEYATITSAGGNPIFIAEGSDVNSIGIADIRFLVHDGDIVLLINASNSTNPLEINVPSVNISGIKVEGIDEDVVGESVVVLEINSERDLLGLSNPVVVENISSFDGVKSFKFNLINIESGDGISIPKGGFIGQNSDNGSSNNRSSTAISCKNMKTTTVNTKINGKNAGKNYSITLKDANGNVLPGKEVLISINGKIYKCTTNDKGVATIKVAFAKKGTYPVVVSFLGDEKYNGSFVVAKIKVNPQKVKLSVAKKKYKVKSKKKYLIATIKSSNKKAIKGKKIVFIVNKKKYTAKTNKKGVAKVKVKLSKKKTYKFKVKFLGDSTFKKISKKGKVKIK